MRNFQMVSDAQPCCKVRNKVGKCRRVMLTIRVFCIQPITRLLPRKNIITASIWHSVVANTNNFLLLVHNTRPDLKP